MKVILFSVCLLFGIHILPFAQEVDFEKDYTSLLTSKIWKKGSEKEILVAYKFNTDGTFFETTIMSPELLLIFDGIAMESMGRWEWLDENTFTMQTTQSIINGKIEDLNPEPYHKAVYRIQQIDLQMIKGVSYNILENEDSEYVYPFKWVVKD